MTEQQKAAMQHALEALENCDSTYGHRCGRCDSEVDEGGKVATALRAALAEPEPEPVAWMFQHDETGRMNYVSNDGLNSPERFIATNPRYALVCALYTTPPTRRPLTDHQRGDLVLEHLGPAALTGGKMSVYDAFLAGLSAAERAHGITGGKDE